MLRRTDFSQSGNIRILGRTVSRKGRLPLFWSGSGVEMTVTGTELYAEITADFGPYEPWLEIEVDHHLSQRRMLERGEHRICIFRSMAEGPARHVRIMKATQAMGGDPLSFLSLDALLTDGEFQPLPSVGPKIEVIGDSITSGEGLGSALCEESWNGAAFSHVESYPFLLARRMNADLHVISQSGYGVYCSWQGRTEESIPPYYEQVCGVLRGAKDRAMGSEEPWDFARWQPDAVVINLGTNDGGSFENHGTFYPESNWRDPMRVNGDGSMNEEDRQLVVSAVAGFLKTVRRNNPGAYILWCYGMLGSPMEGTIREGIERYLRGGEDRRVDYLRLPNAEGEDLGARGHPGTPSHRKAAEALEKKLREAGI